ncbi:hypothetical protein NDU88_005018 [Pleurodeles waltl]|uniref:Uncharacterized protein n=1 Tax=Pleurodeles waltl TaxID=8319 RepID=A0AAV7MAW2_PLEWA|nr:hypothetical protein NDU88_005018 [Pleurodeles waltl]
MKPSRDTSEILAAIQISRIALENKVDFLAMDINHLRLDLHKVGNRVTGEEKEITALQRNLTELLKEIDTLKANLSQLEHQLEDAKS